mmetsp:Transcript_32869/g.52428  ORF Transcript_32869/g.52428 Transcript_32869/m.52428 type:complete len:375 (-) Transcript_32869:1422-2546(-)
MYESHDDSGPVCSECYEGVWYFTIVSISIGTFVSICGMCFLLWHWASPIMRLSQRKFLFRVLLAAMAGILSMLINISQMLNGFDSRAVCWLSTMILPTVHTYMITLITVKEYKMYRFYQAAIKLTRMSASTDFRGKVYICLSVLAAISLAVADVATRHTAVHAYYYTDSDNKQHWVAPCGVKRSENNMLTQAFAGLQLLQLSVQVIIMYVVGWKARNIPTIAGEAKSIYILSATYAGVLLLSVLLHAILDQAIDIKGPDTLRSIRFGIGEAVLAGGLCIIVFIVTYCLVVRKFRYVNMTEDQLFAKFIKSSRVHGDIPKNNVGNKLGAADPNNLVTIVSKEGYIFDTRVCDLTEDQRNGAFVVVPTTNTEFHKI